MKTSNHLFKLRKDEIERQLIKENVKGGVGITLLSFFLLSLISSIWYNGYVFFSRVQAASWGIPIRLVANPPLDLITLISLAFILSVTLFGAGYLWINASIFQEEVGRRMLTEYLIEEVGDGFTPDINDIYESDVLEIKGKALSQLNNDELKILVIAAKFKIVDYNEFLTKNEIRELVLAHNNNDLAHLVAHTKKPFDMPDKTISRNYQAAFSVWGDNYI